MNAVSCSLITRIRFIWSVTKCIGNEEIGTVCAVRREARRYHSVYPALYILPRNNLILRLAFTLWRHGDTAVTIPLIIQLSSAFYVQTRYRLLFKEYASRVLRCFCLIQHFCQCHVARRNYRTSEYERR